MLLHGIAVRIKGIGKTPFKITEFTHSRKKKKTDPNDHSKTPLITGIGIPMTTNDLGGH